MQATETNTKLTADSLLRSINVRYDAEAPARIAHFRPTSKCVALINALLGLGEERSLLVVAPYGTGKSLTAAYLLHLVENRRDSSPALLKISKRLSGVSPELSRFAANRRRSRDRQGVVIALHGHCPSLGESIKEAALESMRRLKLGRQARTLETMPASTVDEAISLLAELKVKCVESGCDRIVVVWDEFGRHLESLVAEGRGDALSEVQLLAEFASRSSDVPLTLGLLLHQGLLNYAANLPQSVRNEWLKIEGRFRTLQYVDDSKEVYRLISEVVCDRSGAKPPTKRALKSAARNCHDLGLFRDLNLAELTDLLYDAYPLDPVTLHLLPRISARVAQNERTLFSFLCSVNLQERVAPAQLYDYFAPAMRADTAVGGTHRQWLETESAVSKVVDDSYATATLKTTCLLGLGTSGQRTRTSRELLMFALQGYTSGSQWKASVEQLLERKLLLHRRHNDEISVWHGTDLDLRGRLDDERHRLVDSFDLVRFLSKEAPPPTWKPAEYNDDYFIRRYLTGEFQTVRQLESFLTIDVPFNDIPSDCDGKILYLVAETAEELARAEELAQEKLAHERVVVAIPSEPLPLRRAAVEVACLTGMQLDSDLIESDPLALSEVRQMTDDARDHLQKLVDKLLQPGPRGPRWFHRGNELSAPTTRDLRRTLSEIMRDVYSAAPRINNEMIVRKKPSPIVINARKKLLLGILERHGQEELGIQGNFPDKSMFRTVLLHTGLYRQDRHGRWGYAAPPAVQDPGLRAVWDKIRAFLTEPQETPKHIGRFFEELVLPPCGVRPGLIPILFTAGLKAFPSAISLTRDGEYITDILPSEIESLCRQPEAYRLLVLDLDEEKLAYLRALHKKFSAVSRYEVAENDLVRMCFDAMEAWKAQLPPAALSTRRLSDRAMQFRKAIGGAGDPLTTLLHRIPEACGQPIAKRKALLRRVSDCMDELAGVAAVYAEQAAAAVRRAVAFDRDKGESIREAAARWSMCFSDKFVENACDGIAKGLVSRLRIPYGTDELLLDSLASLLVGKGVSRWDDGTIAVFERELQSVVRRVEDSAMSIEGSASFAQELSTGLAGLMKGRISELHRRLVALVGSEAARGIVEEMLQESGGKARGHDARGTRQPV